ncbi:MAG: PTS sugar transporter subunit IIA [Lachnospiraceae bacterium]
MSIRKYVSSATTVLRQRADDWEAAVRQAGGLLERAGTIMPAYTNAMIKMVKELGPYIVVMPGVALAHARPEKNVKQNSIAIVTYENGIHFGNESNDPVYVVFAIAARTDDEHLDLFQAVAEFIIGEGNMERLKNAAVYGDIGF